MSRSFSVTERIAWFRQSPLPDDSAFALILSALIPGGAILFQLWLFTCTSPLALRSLLPIDPDVTVVVQFRFFASLYRSGAFFLMSFALILSSLYFVEWAKSSLLMLSSISASSSSYKLVSRCRTAFRLQIFRCSFFLPHLKLILLQQSLSANLSFRLLLAGMASSLDSTFSDFFPFFYPGNASFHE